jgi:hypothetical protein
MTNEKWILIVEDNDGFYGAAATALNDYKIMRATNMLEAERALESHFDYHLVDGCFPFGCPLPDDDRFERYFEMFEEEIARLPFELYAQYLVGGDTDQLPIGLFLAHRLQQGGKKYCITTGGNKKHGNALEAIELASKRMGLNLYFEPSDEAKNDVSYWANVREIIEKGNGD